MSENNKSNKTPLSIFDRIGVNTNEDNGRVSSNIWGKKYTIISFFIILITLIAVIVADKYYPDREVPDMVMPGMRSFVKPPPENPEESINYPHVNNTNKNTQQDSLPTSPRH